MEGARGGECQDCWHGGWAGADSGQGEGTGGDFDLGWESPKLLGRSQVTARGRNGALKRQSRRGMETWADDSTWSQGVDETPELDRLLCRAAWGLDGARHGNDGPQGPWLLLVVQNSGQREVISEALLHQLKSTGCFLTGCHSVLVLHPVFP